MRVAHALHMRRGMLKVVVPVLLALSGCVDTPTDVHVAWDTDRQAPIMTGWDVGVVIEADGIPRWFPGYTNWSVIQPTSGHICAQVWERFYAEPNLEHENQSGERELSDQVCDDVDMSAEMPSATFHLVLR